MSTAFQISEEDVAAVMTHRMEMACDLDRAEELLKLLDTQKIEKAALYGGSMERQTAYAHQEIERQLRAMELGGSAPKLA
jgi:hypothetical protein